MLIKTPTRKSTHRKSCNIQRHLRIRQRQSLLLSSDSKAVKPADTHYYHVNQRHFNPEKRITNSKKFGSSLGCSKQKTQSTKTSKKRRGDDVLNFESYSDSLGRSIHQKLDNSFVKARPSSVKQSRTKSKAKSGPSDIFSNNNIQEMLKERAQVIDRKKKCNDHLEQYLQLLQLTQNNIKRRRYLVEQSRTKLNESWRAMCGLLESNEFVGRVCSLSGDIEQIQSDFFTQQQDMLEEEKFHYVRLLTRHHKNKH